MKKHTHIFFFALIAGITTFGSNLTAMDQKTETETQRQRFEKQFSKAEIAYFHNKHVDPKLRSQLNTVFCRTEVENALSVLYDCHERDDEAKKSAKDILLKNGFAFPYSINHVYTHALFPEFVFKHSNDPSDERLHAGRIRYTQELQEKNLCTCGAKNEPTIKCPYKQAYMPYLDKEKLLPLVIVVAEAVDLSQLRPLSKTQFDRLKTAGFVDTVLPVLLKEGEVRNAGALGNDIMVFDTEPHSTILSYSNKLILFKAIAASWLCMASWVAWKLFFKR